MEKELLTTICFMGAPSTGKSTLCTTLASRYHTLFMPEYGKIYWKDNQDDRRLSLEQLVEIAEGHHQLENEMRQQAKKYLFVDTNAITTYMFSLDYYDMADPRLVELAKEAETRYDLYFICDTDIPYEESWERSGEQHREDFQQQTIKDLEERELTYTLLSGNLEQRILLVEKTLNGYANKI